MRFRFSPRYRLAALLPLFGAAILLSCGREVTAPAAGILRFARGLSFNTVFPSVLQQSNATSLVPFTKVRVVLRRADGSVALDTLVNFPSGSDSVTLSLTVPLASTAPASGEPLSLNLGYINAAGDTVFKGGPVAVTATPAVAGAPAPPPVEVKVNYTGPGASASKVRIAPRSVTVNVGDGFAFTAAALDASGAAVPNTPVVWVSSNPAIAALASATGGAGTALARGTARIIAQLLTGPTDTVDVTVNAKPGSVNVVSGDGQSAAPNAALPQPLVVRVLGSDDKPLAGVAVTFAVTSGGGSIETTSATSDVGGLASTTWRLGPIEGTQTVTVSAAGIPSPARFSAGAVVPQASRLAFSSQPSSVLLGSALGTVSVVAQDADGNFASGFNGAVTVSLNAGSSGATLSGTTTVNAVGGVATFTGLTVSAVGTGMRLLAASGSLSAAVSQTFDITLGEAVSLAFTTSPGNVSAGATLAPSPTVTVLDAAGHVATAYKGNITIAISTNPSGGVLNGSLAFVPVNGVVHYDNLSINKGGKGYTLVATSGSLKSATSSAFDIGLLPASLITATSGDAQSGVAAAALAKPLVVQTVDAFFNGVADVTVTFAAATGGGTLSPTTVKSDKNGFAQTTWTLGTLVGAQSATAKAAGVQNTVTFNATGTANTPKSMKFVLQPASVAAGASLGTLTVQAVDSLGNLASAFTGEVTLKLSGGGTTADSAALALSGTTTAKAVAGVASFTGLSVSRVGKSYLFTATGAGVANTGTSALFDIDAAAASKLAVRTNPGTTSADSTLTAPVFEAQDAFGNLVSGFTGAVTIAISTNPGSGTLSGTKTVNAIAGVVTFPGLNINKTGTGYVLTASTTGLTSAGTAAFTVSAGAPKALTVVSGNAQTGSASTALSSSIVVSVTDANSNAVPSENVTFTPANGGSASPTSSSTDASGQAQTTWTLGSTVGAQTLAVSGTRLASLAKTVTATATANAVITWTGTTSTAWGTASNWSPASVPTSTDSVLIASATNQPSLSIPVTVKSVTIASGATLALGTNGLTVSGSLANSGTISGSGTITMTGTGQLRGAVPTAVTLSGSTTIADATTVSSMTVSGALNLGVAHLKVTNSIATSGSGTITMAAAADSLTVTGNITFGGGSQTSKLTAGKILLAGNFTQSGTITDAFRASGSHEVVLNGTGTQVVTFAKPDSNFAPACTASCFYDLRVAKSTGKVTMSSTVKATHDITFTSADSVGAGSFDILAAHYANLGNISSVKARRVGYGPGVLTRGGGFTVDSLVAFGDTVQIPLSENLPTITRGIVKLPTRVNAGASIYADSGLLLVSGNDTVAGTLNTRNTGAIKITNSGDQLVVIGNATFGGGSTTGLLTDGEIEFEADFRQLGSASSFAPSGNFKATFSGATPLVFFTDTSASFFRNLKLEGGSIPRLTSSAHITGTLSRGNGSSNTGFSATGTTQYLTVSGIDNSSSNPIVFNNVGLKVVNGTTNVTAMGPGIFNSFPANFTGYMLEVNRTQATAIVFSGWNFNNQTLSAAGRYVFNSGSTNISFPLVTNPTNTGWVLNTQYGIGSGAGTVTFP